MIAKTDEHELTKKRQKAWTAGPKKSPDQLQIRIPLCGFHFYLLCRFYREDSNVQASLRGFHHANAIEKFHSQEPPPKSDQSNKPALEKPVKYLTKSVGQRPKAAKIHPSSKRPAKRNSFKTQ